VRIDIDEGVVTLPRIIRFTVVIFCPWLALWVASKQLRIACLIIRNAGMAGFPEDKNMIRWAAECERDGNMIPEPDSKTPQAGKEGA
jgi:hypothetical protein